MLDVYCYFIIGALLAIEYYIVMMDEPVDTHEIAFVMFLIFVIWPSMIGAYIIVFFVNLLLTLLDTLRR